jgi:SAM-dependent methyltransferase
MVCRICGNEQDNQPYTVREMMLGTRDTFDYFRCSACGCLQIQDIPKDVYRYYPNSNYHSYVSPSHYFKGGLKDKFKGLRDFMVMNTGGPLRKAIVKLGKVDTLLPVVAGLSISTSDKVLDIGCGAGVLLYALRNAGYREVVGIDPYITEDIHYPNGLNIYKQSLFEHKGQYNVIMLHHAFEHMDEQLSVMKRIYQMLLPGGRVLIRIPLVSSYAWEKYGTDWVQLDAPRHFYLHSVNSMQLLASKAGFQVDEVLFDSAAFQFWGSELYKRDVPLTNELQNYFSEQELTAFANQAIELNEKRQGDQAAFFLSKANK